jgi:hypothetical protein
MLCECRSTGEMRCRLVTPYRLCLQLLLDRVSPVHFGSWSILWYDFHGYVAATGVGS